MRTDRDSPVHYSWRIWLLALLSLIALVTTGVAAVNADRSWETTWHGEAMEVAVPTVRDITTNLNSFPNGAVPKHERFELTFQVDTVAENLQFPFDAAPPPGIAPAIGVSVDALFTPDNWQTTYTQPAFHYQVFVDEIRDGREWFYPTTQHHWKVRFTPDQSGVWQYKLVARDRGGVATSAPQSFTVVSGDEKGFVRVSTADARYFEFSDGTYFPALGYNMNYNHIGWESPVLDNKHHMAEMQRNGIQLIRLWLTQWGIYGPSWNPWNAIDPDLHAQYIPFPALSFAEAYEGNELSMKLNATYNPCMFIGAWKPKPAVKRNTDYRVRIRYKTAGLDGPRTSGQPFGLVAKTGDWLWGYDNDCFEPGTGTVVTPHQSGDTADWQILEGQLNSGESDFLPLFYLTLENVRDGNAYIDHVWIEEDLGNGQFGPNIVSKPSMAHHLYMEQRNSYAFDKLLELANDHDIYFKVVVNERNDWIFNRFDFDGAPIPDVSECWDTDPDNNPEKCPGNEWFYGDFRQMTKVRWLQQAWWRYLQARWGYSPNIHSWELLNEGNPFDRRHYALADEFGKYMHGFGPNSHLVTTSFWHSFPRHVFWFSPDYPHVDYADVHRYVPQDDADFADAAQATFSASEEYSVTQTASIVKPVIRGETGFTDAGTDPPTAQLLQDTDGIWLHNLLWGGLNAGALIESYWYENVHIYHRDQEGDYEFDHRNHFRPFRNFVESIPLTNGRYRAANVTVSNPDLRAWGQVDIGGLRAHLWLQNQRHTWQNVVNNEAIPPLSATVILTGLQPGGDYRVTWWDTYESDPARQVLSSTISSARQDGTLSLPVHDLSKDIAVQLSLSLPFDQFLPAFPHR